MHHHDNVQDNRCGQCGIVEAAHMELYGTPLGVLNFTFQPDQGPPIEGKVGLCRPCTHEVLSHRLLEAAGVADSTLVAETWK